MKAAIMGYGTIGSGVYEVLDRNCKIVEKKAGEPIKVKYILDLREFPGTPIEKLVIHDVKTIVDDPEIGIVVETMGGITPAYEFVKSCLLAGKHVVTSNKALVAAHGTELIRIAAEKNVSFLFEASVGGGIPIIRPLVECLGGEEIEEISGILNGTTNYILTKMNEEGWSFEEALKCAQELGYAERNPEADVEGYDTCRKIAILTSLASGNQVDFKDIYTEGITKVTAEDFAYAKKAGCAIKLLAVSKKQGDTYCVMVAPAFVRKENPLYMVNDVFNAVCVEGNMLGASMFYGSGAGKLPTASAVAGDMVDAARHLGKIITTFWNPQKLELAPVGEMTHRFFVRMKSDAKDAKVFGDVEMIDAKIKGEIGFMTPVMSEDAFARKAKNLDIISMIRVAG